MPKLHRMGEEDFLYFLDILQKYKVKTKMMIYGWCLMNNHVHLLIKVGNENLSITMKRVCVSFVLYYNGKYRTTGLLFQDRFKSENVENDKYLLTVIRYIHQNPLKADMVKRVDKWRWGSYRGYYGKDIDHRNLLDSEFILGMFGTISCRAERFKEFNEKVNQDKCLEHHYERRLTDEEAREKIKKVLNGIELAQVKRCQY